MKKIFILLAIILAFSSCFRDHVQFDHTLEWDLEKMKELGMSQKTFVIYFSNNLKKLTNPYFTHDKVLGRPENYHILELRSSKLTFSGANADRSDNDLKTEYGSEMISEVHVFITEEYKDQDTVVISKTNFILMREYKTDQGATLFNYIVLTAGILTIVILAFGLIAYHACLNAIIDLPL